MGLLPPSSLPLFFSVNGCGKMWLAAAAYIYKGIKFLFFGKDKISFLFFEILEKIGGGEGDLVFSVILAVCTHTLKGKDSISHTPLGCTGWLPLPPFPFFFLPNLSVFRHHHLNTLPPTAASAAASFRGNFLVVAQKKL